MGFDVKNVPMFPTKHLVVTPSDTVGFAYPTSILVMAAGNVAVADEDGTVVTYLSVPAWTVLPVTVSKVMATNTTVAAGNLVALYGET